MSTIAVLTSGENGANSLTDINSNFANLNTDKLEAATTATLTNKRVTPRITTITSSATPTVNTDNCDAVTITALATNITSMTSSLSGTPTNFDRLLVRIKDDGTARTISWGTSFEAKGVTLPTTTVISKLLTTLFVYDTVTSKWGCIYSALEGATTGGITSGATTHDISSNSAQTIAHSLGVTPKFVKITVTLASNSGSGSIAVLTYASAQAAVNLGIDNGTGTNGTAGTSGHVWNNIGSPTGTTVGLGAPDATNLNLTWTKDVGSTGTANILWEAYS